MSGVDNPSPYAELHLHTCYSLLEGASTPRELIVRAARHGYDALAITDRNNLYGAMVFARACRDAGFRSIIGVELTVAGDPDVDPDADHDGLWVTLAPALERASLPGPVSELSVELRGLRPSRGWQGELLPTRRTSPERRGRIEGGMRPLRGR